MNEDIRVKKGQILVYRVYDIGSEIDLDKVEALFENKAFKKRFKLDRKHNTSIIISNSPLSVHWGNVELKILDQLIEAELVIKAWQFGTVSLCLQIPIAEGTGFNDLIKTGHFLENDEQIEKLTREKSKEFQTHIIEAIPVSNDWSINEDYITYFFQELIGYEGPLRDIYKKVPLPALILGETKQSLSRQINEGVLKNFYQYSEDDLVIVDWNSALVFEPSDSMDVPLVIEFALNQLLEMRYYDDLLDQKLNTLYNEVVNRNKGIFSNRYSRLAEEASQIYLEISEIVENVENSLKTVGDFYLATIFRATSQRFRFSDWQKSIDDKLNNLAEVSKLLHSEVNESRNQTLEIIIIILIAIEVIPFIYNLIM